MEPKTGLTGKQRWFLGCGMILILGVMVFFGFLLKLFGSFSFSDERVLSGEGKEKIAVVWVNGEITEGSEGSSLWGTASSDAFSFRNQLENIANDPNVKALILRVNSPGGSAVASEEMYQSLIKFKESNKKVVVSMGGVAASGGYYLSLAADSIIASQATVTGSIGVITEIINVSGLYEKLGLESEIYKSGKEKDIFSGTRERSPEEKMIIQKLIDDSYNLFFQRVSENRKIDQEPLKKIADGRIYSGQEAYELKLIDEIGSFEDAVEKAEKLAGVQNAQLVEYTKNNLFNWIIGNFTKNSELSNKLNSALQLFNPTPGVRIRYLMSP